MYEIIPNLYLSSWKDVENKEIDDNWFVVNCTKDLPMVNNNNLRISVNDDKSEYCMYEMENQLPNAIEKIEESLKNKKVVVHCKAGQQRSATVIAAYLIKKTDMNFRDAIALVKEKKRDAFFWQVNFWSVLSAL